MGDSHLDIHSKIKSMVATKIFKKCSPNGRLYLYLGQREYISADQEIDDIKGIAYLPEVSDLQGKFIFASLVVTFRHGREEDEMMGVSFKKELWLIGFKSILREKMIRGPNSRRGLCRNWAKVPSLSL